MAGRELVAGRLRPRRVRVSSARVGLLTRGPVVADASLVRRRPGNAEGPGLPRAPQSAGAGDHDLDGWPASSTCQHPAYLERIYDRGVGRGRPRDADHSSQGNVHPAIGSHAQRPLDRAFAMAPHRRLPADHVDSLRPRPDVGAVHSNDDDVDRGSHAGCRAISVRGGDGGCRSTRGGAAFPSRAEFATRSRSETDGSLWHSVRGKAGWFGDDVSRVHRQDEDAPSPRGIASRRSGPRRRWRKLKILFWIPVAFALAVLAAGERAHAQAPQSPARRSAWPPKLEEPAPGEVEVLPVRGNVHVIMGAGGNITVQVGEQGILLVDTGVASMSEKVWAAVQKVAPPRKVLRYVINTDEDPEHTGGNAVIAAKGQTVPLREANYTAGPQGTINYNRASVVAHQNVLNRMSAPTGEKSPTPPEAWPDNTYAIDQKRFYFNDEPVVMMNFPGNTDGNTIVFFRKSDVISTGDLID